MNSNDRKYFQHLLNIKKDTGNHTGQQNQSNRKRKITFLQEPLIINESEIKNIETTIILNSKPQIRIKIENRTFDKYYASKKTSHVDSCSSWTLRDWLVNWWYETVEIIQTEKIKLPNSYTSDENSNPALTHIRSGALSLKLDFILMKWISMQKMTIEETKKPLTAPLLPKQLGSISINELIQSIFYMENQQQNASNDIEWKPKKELDEIIKHKSQQEPKPYTLTEIYRFHWRDWINILPVSGEDGPWCYIPILSLMKMTENNNNNNNNNNDTDKSTTESSINQITFEFDANHDIKKYYWRIQLINWIHEFIVQRRDTFTLMRHDEKMKIVGNIIEKTGSLDYFTLATHREFLFKSHLAMRFLGLMDLDGFMSKVLMVEPLLILWQFSQLYMTEICLLRSLEKSGIINEDDHRIPSNESNDKQEKPNTRYMFSKRKKSNTIQHKFGWKLSNPAQKELESIYQEKLGYPINTENMLEQIHKIHASHFEAYGMEPENTIPFHTVFRSSIMAMGSLAERCPWCEKINRKFPEHEIKMINPKNSSRSDNHFDILVNDHHRTNTAQETFHVMEKSDLRYLEHLYCNLQSCPTGCSVLHRGHLYFYFNLLPWIFANLLTQELHDAIRKKKIKLAVTYQNSLPPNHSFLYEKTLNGSYQTCSPENILRIKKIIQSDITDFRFSLSHNGIPIGCHFGQKFLLGSFGILVKKSQSQWNYPLDYHPALLNYWSRQQTVLNVITSQHGKNFKKNFEEEKIHVDTRRSMFAQDLERYIRTFYPPCMVIIILSALKQWKYTDNDHPSHNSRKAFLHFILTLDHDSELAELTLKEKRSLWESLFRNDKKITHSELETFKKMFDQYKTWKDKNKETITCRRVQEFQLCPFSSNFTGMGKDTPAPIILSYPENDHAPSQPITKKKPLTLDPNNKSQIKIDSYLTQIPKHQWNIRQPSWSQLALHDQLSTGPATIGDIEDIGQRLISAPSCNKCHVYLNTRKDLYQPGRSIYEEIETNKVLNSPYGYFLRACNKYDHYGETVINKQS